MSKEQNGRMAEWVQDIGIEFRVRVVVDQKNIC